MLNINYERNDQLSCKVFGPRESNEIIKGIRSQSDAKMAKIVSPGTGS
ncbi:MAG: hypothetical protein ACUVQ9_01330 [Thermodesulfobacteriota bacterium]